jgi:hypothetical protein
MMRKFVLAFIVMITMTTLSSAQEYETAAGLRGGLYNGLTIKHFLGGKSAVEGIITSRWYGFNVTGLYELHKWRAFDVDRLNWYYGVGGHLGVWEENSSAWLTGNLVIGADLILGIEYTFEEIPINIGVDWKPAFNFIGADVFRGDGGAFSARYVF